jgi:hypothetical protein
VVIEDSINEKVESSYFKSKICLTCNRKIISGIDYEELVKHYKDKHEVIDDERTSTDILCDIVGKPGISDRFEKGRPIEQIENYLNSVVMDEKILVKKILRVGFSAYTNNPINLGIMAPSSEGKTYAVVHVMDLFPKEDVVFVGGMSPTAFIHARGNIINENNEPLEPSLEKLRIRLVNDKEHEYEIKKEMGDLISKSKTLIDLQGKILVFLDAPHIELWDRLKTILSHDKYEIEFKITDKGKSGQLTVKNVVIRGWPSCIFCSAKNERKSSIWEEIETRFLITSPNTDVSKYKKANKLTTLKFGIPDFASEIICSEEDEKYAKYWIRKISEQIQRLSKDKKNPIWNPFSEIISEYLPSNEGITMRNTQRFMTLCNIETLVNSDTNYTIEYITNNGMKKQYVITSLRDIDNAIKMMGSISVIPTDKLKFVTDILQPCITGQLVDGVTTKELAEKYKQVYKKETTPKKILETYLTPLYHYGIVDSKDNPNDNRQNLYRIVTSPNSNTLEFIKSKIIEESNKNDLFVWSGIEKLRECSNGKGNINAIFDHEGNAVSQNSIQEVLLYAKHESKVIQIAQAENYS